MSAARTVARTVTTGIVCAVVFLPILLFAMTSILERGAVLSRHIDHLALTSRHYAELMERTSVGRLLFDSLTLSTVSTGLALLLAFPAAYYVARRGGALGESLYAVSLTLWLAPPVALSLQLYFWFQRVGLFDRLQGLMLLNSVLQSTLALLLLAPFIARLSRRLDEMAWIDGVAPAAVLVRIYVPALRVPLAGIALLCFLRVWNELLFASLLTDRRVTLLPVTLLAFTTGSHIEWGQIAALGTISLIPVPLFLAVVILSLRGGR